MTGIKKNVLTVMVAFAALLAVCFWGRISVEAASGTAASKKWAKAYMKVIKKMNKEDAKKKAEYKSSIAPYTPYTYDLIYFDGDTVPELVVGVHGYWVSMYTYDKKKNKVYTVMDNWGYGIGANAGYEYIPKKNFLRNYNSDYAGALQYVYCGKMKNHKIASRYAKEITVRYFVDKNKNGYPDMDEYTQKPAYYYGKKKISKAKFDSYVKSSKKTKLILGKYSYSKMKKKLAAKGA